MNEGWNVETVMAHTWAAFCKHVLGTAWGSWPDFLPGLLSEGADLGKVMNSAVHTSSSWQEWELK